MPLYSIDSSEEEMNEVEINTAFNTLATTDWKFGQTGSTANKAAQHLIKCFHEHSNFADLLFQRMQVYALAFAFNSS